MSEVKKCQKCGATLTVKGGKKGKTKAVGEILTYHENRNNPCLLFLWLPRNKSDNHIEIDQYFVASTGHQ